MWFLVTTHRQQQQQLHTDLPPLFVHILFRNSGGVRGVWEWFLFRFVLMFMLCAVSFLSKFLSETRSEYSYLGARGVKTAENVWGLRKFRVLTRCRAETEPSASLTPFFSRPLLLSTLNTPYFLWVPLWLRVVNIFHKFRKLEWIACYLLLMPAHGTWFYRVHSCFILLIFIGFRNLRVRK